MTQSLSCLLTPAHVNYVYIHLANMTSHPNCSKLSSHPSGQTYKPSSRQIMELS